MSSRRATKSARRDCEPETVNLVATTAALPQSGPPGPYLRGDSLLTLRSGERESFVRLSAYCDFAVAGLFTPRSCLRVALSLMR